MRPRSSGRSTEARIAELETMTAPKLRQHWLRIFDRSPPRWLSRQLMLHALAYRLQEQAEGDLNRAALKRLRQLVDPNGADVPSLPPSTPRLKPGMGWQEHSVRGFLAATVRKMPGVILVSEKAENGPRRYRVEEAGA